MALKIESPAFTPAHVNAFLDELEAHDRDLLADRLERASARLAELGTRITAGSGGDAWSAHETLAHIAVLSKFYGVLVHKIAGGGMTELNLLQNVNLRDVAGQQMAELAPEELVRMARADHQRTLTALREMPPRNLRRAARLEDGSQLTAGEVARLPLISHLEMHLGQLERALTG